VAPKKAIPLTSCLLLERLVELISEFEIVLPDTSIKEPYFVKPGPAIDPSQFQFDDVVRHYDPSRSMHQQEDAQEFLNFVLDRLHDELLEAESNTVKLNKPVVVQLKLMKNQVLW